MVTLLLAGVVVLAMALWIENAILVDGLARVSLLFALAVIFVCWLGLHLLR